MARLWMTIKSDLRKGTGQGASEAATVSVFYGSARHSRLVGELSVIWRKNDKPIGSFKIGDDFQTDKIGRNIELELRKSVKI
jgi:hypothetical protein